MPVSWDYCDFLICLLEKLSDLTFEIGVKFFDHGKDLIFLTVLKELVCLLDIAKVETPREEGVHIKVLVSIF